MYYLNSQRQCVRGPKSHRLRYLGLPDFQTVIYRVGVKWRHLIVVLVCISLEPLFIYLLVLYSLFRENACSKSLPTFLFSLFLSFVLSILILCQLHVVSVIFHFQLNFYVVEFKVHIYNEPEFTDNFLSYTCPL